MVWKTNTVTETIYGFIRDNDYKSAIANLKLEQSRFPRSRAIRSLLAYCFYHTQDYQSAAVLYEQLAKSYPDIEEYNQSWVHSLIQSGAIQDAEVHLSELYTKSDNKYMIATYIYVKLEMDDLDGCRNLLEDKNEENPSILFAQGLVDYRDGLYHLALGKFLEASNFLGYQPALQYNIALCHYMMKEFSDAIEIVDTLISKGLDDSDLLANQTRDHQNLLDEELCLILQDSALFEAFNLKAAIEFLSGDNISCRRTLDSMPSRLEHLIDPVSLHNVALVNVNMDIEKSFDQFRFLLSNPPFPPVTFQNLLLLYIQHNLTEIAADFIANNKQLALKFVDEDVSAYIRTVISQDENEISEALESMYLEYATSIRNFQKDLLSTSLGRNKEHVRDLEDVIKRKKSIFIPILMKISNHHWSKKDYESVENLLRDASDICKDSTEWKLNMAHTLFVQQGSKLKECIQYYESCVDDQSHASILDTSPVVLANLCVSYILSSENERAETVLERIEKRERESLTNNDDNEIVTSRSRHSYIVNLVIGTLYCEKGNFEFGIERMKKGLEPFDVKLNADTWYYVKRCLADLADKVAKLMMVLSPPLKKTVMSLLMDVEKYSRNVEDSDGSMVAMKVIETEARKLKMTFLELSCFL